MTAQRLPGTAPPPALGSVVVIGTGLIGTSIALALRERGVAVWLSDHDGAAARLAADIGAGTVLPDAGTGLPGPPAEGVPGRGAPGQGAPGQVAPGQAGTRADLAVLAVPPAAVAPTLAAAQADGLARWYTDVASVKTLPLRQARDLGCDLGSFVPGHPLSGRERSGPAAARADLFLGRPWVICPAPQTVPDAVAAVTELVRCCRGEPVRATPDEHDRWVALVSHAPHVVAAAMAAQLADAPGGALGLAGQGLRDVTRIAEGDAGLWMQILAANAEPLARVLGNVASDLAAAAETLAGAGTAATGPGAGQPSLKLLAALLEQGSAGVARIPGKRGKPARADALVQVVIRDQPGELARLFQVAGQAGVNIEDIGIEHSPGLPVGVAELTVRPEAAAHLTQALASAGWPVRR